MGQLSTALSLKGQGQAAGMCGGLQLKEGWHTGTDCVLGGRRLLQEDAGEITTQAALPTGQTFSFSVSSRVGKYRAQLCSNLNTYCAPPHTKPTRV